jgi:glycolate oxidase FAD binding subunit
VSTTNLSRPTDVAQARAALTGHPGPVLIRGAGTAADWAGEPATAAVVLDTTAMTGVLAHNPADMTVEVRAGTPLRELNAALAEHGQRVALDAARVRRGATVGGLLATADSGPSAPVYGSLRDLVIGATVVLADGTVARTGGHVIKNVAGYDLAKLVHGSHGALALVAEVVLRLHPVPEASATVRLGCPLEQAGAAAAAVLAAPVEPVAVEWCAGALLIRLEGGAAALPDRVAQVTGLLAEHGYAAALADAEADQVWAEHCAQVDRPADGTALLRVGTRPSRLAGLLRELGGRQAVAGLATGIGTVAVAAEVDAVAEAHQAVHRAGGVSVLRARPPGSGLAGWGPQPSAIGVLRAVKAQLDPIGRLGNGRFAPWM